MLRRALHDIIGMRIHATDGILGHVRDVYFENGQWLIRYFEIDTSHWLLDRHVLLAPTAVQSLDWEHGRVHVALTREQVRNSPDIDSHKPVSRQHQAQLHEYFQWPFQSSDGVWRGEELAAELHKLMIETRGQEVPVPLPEQTKDDPHLWSARALSHYGLQGTDGDLGRVDDFLVYPDAWTIRHIVIATGSPLQARACLVPVDRITRISWDAKRIRVAMGRKTIGGLPRFAASQPLTQDELDRLAGTNR
jgi:uncharacterized protein YrrD